MYFEFELKIFVGAWRDYQDNQSLGMVDQSHQDSYNHHGIDCGYSHGLKQTEFLREYLRGVDNHYKPIMALLSGVEPEAFYIMLKQGLKFLPDVTFTFNGLNRVHMDVGYQDDQINFEAKREFYLDDNDNLCVEHDTMHVLDAVGQPMNIGVGSRFLNNSLHLYDRLNIRKIRIPSPQQKGIHAWLKMGFVVPRKNWHMDLAERFDVVIDGFEDQQIISTAMARNIRHIASQNGRYVLNAIARSDKHVSIDVGKEQHLLNAVMDDMMNGSALMETEFGCGYEANLHSHVQRQRFNKYFIPRVLKPLPRYGQAGDITSKPVVQKRQVA